MLLRSTITTLAFLAVAICTTATAAAQTPVDPIIFSDLDLSWAVEREATFQADLGASGGLAALDDDALGSGAIFGRVLMAIRSGRNTWLRWQSRAHAVGTSGVEVSGHHLADAQVGLSPRGSSAGFDAHLTVEVTHGSNRPTVSRPAELGPGPFATTRVETTIAPRFDIWDSAPVVEYIELGYEFVDHHLFAHTANDSGVTEHHVFGEVGIRTLDPGLVRDGETGFLHVEWIEVETIDENGTHRPAERLELLVIDASQILAIEPGVLFEYQVQVGYGFARSHDSREAESVIGGFGGHIEWVQGPEIGIGVAHRIAHSPDGQELLSAVSGELYLGVTPEDFLVVGAGIHAGFTVLTRLGDDSDDGVFLGFVRTELHQPLWDVVDVGIYHMLRNSADYTNEWRPSASTFTLSNEVAAFLRLRYDA